MRQLRCIATYNRRPKTSAILNRNTRQHDTSYSQQLFVLTEFTSASINNHCLDTRRQDWLHCLTRLTNCYQHSHVSLTQASAHALWCAVKRNSLTHHNITYLTCDGSRFCVTTLTCDLMTFNFGSESAVKKLATKFTGSIVNEGLSSDPQLSPRPL